MFANLGIGARLFIAFLGITALSLSSGIGSWLILRRVSEAQYQINAVALPAVAATQQASDAIARLVATAPRLTAARNEAERTRREAELELLVGDIRRNVADVGFGALDRRSVKSLSNTVDLLVSNLDVQNSLVRERLALQTTFSSRTVDAIGSATSIVDLAETLVSNASAGASAVIAGLYGLIDETARHPAAYNALDRLIEQDIYLLDRMSELRLRSSQIGLLVNRLTRAITVDEVLDIAADYNRHLRVVVRRVASIDDPVRQKQALDLLYVLEASNGISPWGKSIFAQRVRLIQIGLRLEELSLANRKMSDDVSAVSRTMLAASEAYANKAASQAKQAVDTGLYMLVISSLAAVLISGLIVWLYVERSVVRRIGNIAEAMRRLTSGDTNVEVDDDGTRELKDLSRAVTAFRDESVQRRALEIERNRTNEELRRHREELQELVTERTIQLEREVALHGEARIRAESASLAKSEFLATMSHEIRTPMTGMLGMVRILGESRLDKNQRQQLQIVSSSGKALLGILNNILDFSKLEFGKVEADSESFSLRESVAGVVALMHPAAEEKHLDLTLTFAPGLWKQHRGDAGKIRQIIFNLVSNAIKFTEQGRIDVHVARTAGDQSTQRVDISVTDTGIGIAKDDHGRIFESFTQGDASITRRFGGTGLGLAISRRFAEVMGGRLDVSSGPGTGSTFTLSVPLEKAPRRKAPAKAPLAISGHEDKPLQVLVVEDDAATRIVAQAFLERMGCDVQLAADGFEAVRLAERAWPDFVLMDISLPGIDGIETARRLRSLENGAELPILAMSAHVFLGDAHTALDPVLNGAIAKPLTPEALESALRAVLAGRPPDTATSQIDSAAFEQDIDTLGREEMGRILDIAETFLPLRFSEMRRCLEQSDFTALAALAHKTRSSAAAAGFGALIDSAALLEAAAGVHDNAGAALNIESCERNFNLAMEKARQLLRDEPAAV